MMPQKEHNGKEEGGETLAARFQKDELSFLGCSERPVGCAGALLYLFPVSVAWGHHSE